jgi:hypothetical protein
MFGVVENESSENDVEAGFLGTSTCSSNASKSVAIQ